MTTDGKTITVTMEIFHKAMEIFFLRHKYGRQYSSFPFFCSFHHETLSLSLSKQYLST